VLNTQNHYTRCSATCHELKTVARSVMNAAANKSICPWQVGIVTLACRLGMPFYHAVSSTNCYALLQRFSNFFISRTPKYWLVVCGLLNTVKFTVLYSLHNVIFSWKTCWHLCTDVHWCFLLNGELILTRCRNTQLDFCGQQRNLYVAFGKNSCIAFGYRKWHA